jgi:Signal transduction histidine kinase
MKIKDKTALICLLLIFISPKNLFSQTDLLLNQFRETPKILKNIPRLIDLTNRLSDYNIGDALNCAYQIEGIKIPSGNHELQCSVLICMGTLKKIIGQYDESNKHYFRALDIAEKNRLISFKIVSLYQIGDLNRCIGLHDQSLYYLYLSKNEALRSNTIRQYPQLYERISSTFYQLTENDSPKFKLTKIPYQNEFSLDKSTSADYGNLCNIYADSALMFADQKKDYRIRLSCLNIKGAYYRYLKRYDLALDYFNKAINESEKFNYRTDIPNYYTNIARTYYLNNQYKKAIKYGLIAFRLADESNILVYKSTAADILRISYMEMDDYKNALTYQHLEACARAEINDQKNWNTISELGRKYQDQQKQKEIEHQKKLLDLKNAAVFRRNVAIIVLFITCILIVIGIVYIYRNSLKLAKANRKIAEQNEELSQMNITKNKLISIIAHDLRGSVGSMKSVTAIMCEQKDNKDLVNDFVPLLAQQSERTYSMLNNLLLWVRNQLQSPDVVMECQLILPILSDCKKFVQQFAYDKNIEITINAQDNITACFDKEMITIVVRNLFNNAIKFTHKGGTITVRVFYAEGQVMVEVADTGIGLPKENISKIFDPYEYYSSFGTNAERGTGLGLKICNELIEKNHGKLYVRDNTPQGTVFSFNLSAC